MCRFIVLFFKVPTASTPVIRRDTRNTVSSSGVDASRVLSHLPKTSSADTSSSTDLLKHLQERVKKLRAENENLKKSNDKETSFSSTKQDGRLKSFSKVCMLERVCEVPAA